jgi:hypothetical protein
MKVASGVYAVVLLFEMFMKQQPNGVVTAAMLGVIFNCWKQYELVPASRSELQSRIDLAGKHVFRRASTVGAQIVTFPDDKRR